MSIRQLRFFGISGALLAMLAVGMGAFAAHGLKSILEPSAIQTIKTAVLYQFIHSLSILLIISLAVTRHFRHLVSILIKSAGAMLIGTVLFSGSLYCIALTQIKWFGPITPIGGVAFIVGWLLLLIAFSRLEPSASVKSSAENFND